MSKHARLLLNNVLKQFIPDKQVSNQFVPMNIRKLSTSIRMMSENSSSFPKNNFPGLGKHLIHSRSASGEPSAHPYTIVVEGNIGSGKTTFLRPFMDSNNNHSETIQNIVEIIEEPVSRWRNLHGTNLLKLMYEDPKRWSLMFQTYVQLTMIEHHTKPCTKPIRMMERSLARYCFVENLYNGGLMNDAEYAVISEWFNFLVTCPKLDFKVDQILYLRTDPEVAYERIKKRLRPEEHLIPFKYIQDLHELHEDWLVKKTKFQPLIAPVTIIDANLDLELLQEQFKNYGQELLHKAKRSQ